MYIYDDGVVLCGLVERSDISLGMVYGDKPGGHPPVRAQLGDESMGQTQAQGNPQGILHISNNEGGHPIKTQPWLLDRTVSIV